MNHQKVEKQVLHESKETPQAEAQDLTAALRGYQTHGYGRMPMADNQSGSRSQADGAAALSILSGQMIAYFGDRAYSEDMHALSFSLQHLYGSMDYLYRFVLPELLKTPRAAAGAETSPLDELVGRYTIWTKLRAIRQTFSRVEQLGTLLNDAAAAILDALDLTGEAQNSLEKPVRKDHPAPAEPEWLRVLNQERWDLAFTKLTACLCSWQKEYSQLPLIASYFEPGHPSLPALASLDDVFAALLDSAGSIFGEILPEFHALSAGDDEIAATLLYDAMQQVDQLLQQFDLALEPLHALIEYFTIMPRC
jgi:hypothetical protein